MTDDPSRFVQSPSKLVELMSVLLADLHTPQRRYDDKAADLAVSIVTIGGKLPIGLSTSPFLSNLTFLGTDWKLAEYAETERLSFTRYVDDLAFSGEITDRHLVDIERILDDAGWSVNRYKTAFMRRADRST